MRCHAGTLRVIAMLPLLAGGCRTAHPASGSSSDTSRLVPTPAIPDVVRGRATGAAADAEFLRDMIVHHAQALAMVDLIPGRTGREDIKLLGERIKVSQQDEIRTMRRWLRERGDNDPDSAAAHGHDAAAGARRMPGMLTGEELARLAASSGSAFERHFLELMIRHHEGALVMVERLFSTHGAAQETEIYFFASNVDADQRAEIGRMRGMLARMSSTPGAP